MTKTELYNIMIDVISEADDKFDKAALTELCEKEIEHLAAKAARAKKAAMERKEDSDDLTEVIASVLTDEPQLIDDITARIAGPDITKSKITSRLGRLAREGRAVMVKVKVEGSKSKRSAYAAAPKAAEA